MYAGITVYAYFLDTEAEFFALAVTVGFVQGGVQSLSRSLFGRLVPEGKNAEFFGFYNMMGKFATVLGPLLIAIVARAHAQRTRLDHLAGVAVRDRRRVAVARAGSHRQPPDLTLEGATSSLAGRRRPETQARVARGQRLDARGEIRAMPRRRAARSRAALRLACARGATRASLRVARSQARPMRSGFTRATLRRSVSAHPCDPADQADGERPAEVLPARRVDAELRAAGRAARAG